MKTLYFDCFSGASGNMILGGLLELGVDADALRNELAKLNLSGIELVIEKVDRSGINSTHVEVKYPHEHVHRHLKDIVKIIDDSSLSAAVKQRAISIFTRLAEAEAKVHGIPVERVHFHEVGALDAIVDIVGVCIGFEMLGIERFLASALNLGSGTVEIAHGKFPVPPPAVAELVRGIPVHSSEGTGELVTPTGAAIITTVCDSYGVLPQVILEQIGYGAGTRDTKGSPNAIRLMVGETAADEVGSKGRVEKLTVLESNIDDASPQVLGFAMEKAFELNALDCWFTPIQMKKNRPATLFTVLCEPANVPKIEEMLFRETTTLGIRRREIERTSLERSVETVSTEWGEVRVKVSSLGGEIITRKPEFDDLKRIADGTGLTLRSVEATVEGILNERDGVLAKTASKG
ncbi:MAG: nickel pincer cofactor biosynthesis protein LarC [Acidobacteria bacterium]|nr:Pyridinium-3,5-bisthiocarboxylic acid mononucleotide nickel insertion protein [Pyrinomonadaceae bacterium]RIJ94032.1 MAG: nickel pincer cofactor biosynthesis protein LarC [Acidobacteriota bacterium]